MALQGLQLRFCLDQFPVNTSGGLRILGGVQPTGRSTATSSRFAAAWARARGIS
jgi:hypothetical protein